MKQQILAITRKELNNYFGSPLALIFLGVFLAATLFLFFTYEGFFARGIADVRPLFNALPLLLILLLAALTMRQWSEEQRSGTQELLLTLPASHLALVLGKFLAVMLLIVVALGLTLPLPITVAVIGNLDWGPVIGGYLAALLLAGAYAAIGLFISSRTDNQIVALILTALVGGLFYLIGTRAITDFVGGAWSELLWAFGTGSRFESIQRGVIDLRDLVYYVSLTAFFLLLNVVSLDSLRWSDQQTAYRRRLWLTTGLLGANLLLLNVWLYPLRGLRLDVTQQRQYTLSDTTRDLLANLPEPLLIRAYISQNNHPLLTPLIPQVRDMLREYEIASAGQVTTELVDPADDPDLEAEANQTYGIRPSPFRVSGRYEASIINAYFDILVRYGDQSEVVNFADIIQVSSTPAGDIDVSLRNLEYDLTRAVKRTVFGFQSLPAMLAAQEQPVSLTYYVTSNTLPTPFVEVEAAIRQVAEEIAAEAQGKLTYQVIDLDAPDGQASRAVLQETYALQPIPVGLFATDTFYAHLILQNGEQWEALFPATDLTQADIRAAIESALKRTSTGFLKVVGVWTPDPALAQQFGGQMQPLTSYNNLQETLRQEYEVRSVTPAEGVPPDVDVLLVLAPQGLTERDLFALDQYLMRGGSLVLAFNPNQVLVDGFNGTLTSFPADVQNVTDWLAHHGVTVGNAYVMDPQNQPFPIATLRDVGGFQVQEIQALDYPFFVDVRPDGMATDSPILSNLPAVTLNWVSPVEVAEAADTNRTTTQLLRSSDNAWLNPGPGIQPDFGLYPDTGFGVGETIQSYPLAAAIQGRFTSFFDAPPTAITETVTAPLSPTVPLIPQSPESSRLVVIGSASFVDDFVLDISSRFNQDRFTLNLQLVQNIVDWASEDLDLLTIRSRGNVTRVLDPLEPNEQRMWEMANYVVALAALLAIYYAWRVRARDEKPLFQSTGT